MKKGFTLIELLVVIAIIGLLASVVLVSMGGIRAKARDSRRIEELRQLQKAVELYYAQYERYPQPAGGWGTWSGHCDNYGNYDKYILGLEPWMPNLPKDPNFDGVNLCYLYRSDGNDYAILAYFTMETLCDGSDGDAIKDPGDECNPPNIQRLERACCEEPTISVYSSGAIGW